MIRKYHESPYESINKNQYIEMINGEDKWSTSGNKLLNFSTNDVNLIISLGFEVELSKITNTDKDSISIYKKSNIIPIFIITKTDDEYFMVNRLIPGRDRYSDSNLYYKCDQITGLIEFLKEISC